MTRNVWGLPLLQGIAKRVGSLAALILVVIFLSANKACREDYFFATQSDIAATVTPTGSPRVDPTETPEPDETVTATPTTTGTPTRTPRATRTPTTSAQPAFALLRDLESASEPASDDEEEDGVVPSRKLTPGAGAANGAAPQKGSVTGNWLGNLYGGSEVSRAPVYVVGEAPGYQRSVSSLLKGLGVESRVVDSASELGIVRASAESPSVVVLDAQSAAFPPCQSVAQISSVQRDSSKRGKVAYVVVGSASQSSASIVQGSFFCSGKAVAEVVPSPVNRIGLKRAIERAVNRSENAD